MLLFGIKFDKFLGALLLAIAAAAFAPSIGSTGSMLHVDLLARYGVVILFFLNGLTLDPGKLRAGLMHYRVHAIVQFVTFVLFPLLVFGLSEFLRPVMTEEAWTGLFLLSALPSTVTLSVVMVARAGGNVPAAAFNATLSSLIGVIVTPLLMAWYLSRTNTPFNLGHVMPVIVGLVVLPNLLGVAARCWLAEWAASNKPRIQFADRTIMVAIVYSSFCNSFQQGTWSIDRAGLAALFIAAAIVLFSVAYLLVATASDLLGLPAKDRTACTFCGSQKSLATGAPLATMMFGSSASLGVIIAPVIIYHFCQLIFTSVIASRKASLILSNELGLNAVDGSHSDENAPTRSPPGDGAIART